MNLGIDLQGGLHLVMGVDTEKAILDRVDRTGDELVEAMKEKGKPAKSAKRVGDDAEVELILGSADDFSTFKEIADNYRGAYEVKSHVGDRVIFAMTDDYKTRISEDSVDQAQKTLRNRIDKYGVTEPEVRKRGSSSILIQIAGLTAEAERDVKETIIGRTAQLEFKIVDDDADDYMKKVAAIVPKDGPVKWEPDQWGEKSSGKQHDLIYLRAKDRADLDKFIAGLAGDAAVPPDREFGLEEITTPQEGEATPEKHWRAYLLKKRAGVTGEYLANADEDWDEFGKPQVAFQMDRTGAELMGRLTGENVGRRMAIVLDEKVTSAPVIESKISDRGRITMGSSLDPIALRQEVKDLIAVLRSGALPAPLRKSFETQVGPTLGEDSISRALFSMYAGAAAVILFMLIYYRLAGFIAVIGMMLNLLFLVAILAAFEASLTLPGIAGLVLTIGMAVDASIIIFERIREELRLGKSARTAVDAGFDRAFWSIFDGHITTLVAGVVLYSYGSGPIRGFAVSLLVGVIANLFTSVWMSRWMFDLIVGRRGHAPATLSI
jgi:preprotein translocase subunit SecD